MKKVLLAALLLTSVSSFAFSNVISANVVVKADPVHVVPQAVQQSFNNRFRAVSNVKWSVQSTPASLIFVADFIQGDKPATEKHVRASFTANGTFFGKQFVYEP